MERSERNKLLHKVSLHSFAAYELHLFLDTHPNDAQALEAYRKHIAKAVEAKRAYEDVYGPLSANDVKPGSRWTWIDDPWPWNNEEDAYVSI